MSEQENNRQAEHTAHCREFTKLTLSKFTDFANFLKEMDNWAVETDAKFGTGNNLVYVTMESEEIKELSKKVAEQRSIITKEFGV